MFAIFSMFKINKGYGFRRYRCWVYMVKNISKMFWPFRLFGQIIWWVFLLHIAYHFYNLKIKKVLSFNTILHDNHHFRLKDSSSHGEQLRRRFIFSASFAQVQLSSLKIVTISDFYNFYTWSQLKLLSKNGIKLE